MGKRGRGSTRIEQQGIVRKVAEEHGTPVIRLPKTLRDVGVYLGQEVIVVVERGVNPLAWEIKIKPKQEDQDEP